MKCLLQHHGDTEAQRVLFSPATALAFALVTAIYGWPLLFGGQTLAGNDIVNAYLPYKFLVKEHLARGEFPHWNPLTFGGRPLQADIQVGLFYPPNLLFWLLPLERAFDLALLLHLWLGGVGMALWMRRRTARAAAAWFAGGLFMFSGYAAGRIGNGVTLFPNAMAWLPWLLVCWDRFSASQEENGGGRGPNLAALTLVMALSALSGAPQITFYSFAALGLYALIGAWRSQGDLENAESYEDAASAPSGEGVFFRFPLRVKPVAALFGAFLLAGGICAVQILPTAMFIGESWDRASGVSWQYVVHNSLPPRMLLAMISPFFFGDPFDGDIYWGPIGYHEVTAYLGAIPLLFLCLFLAGRWGPWRAGWSADLSQNEKRSAVRLEVFLLVLLILAALFSFGKHSPFFWLAYHFVPGFDRFREPGRFLLYYTFAAAALSGWVLDRLAARGDATTERERGEGPRGKPAARSFFRQRRVALILGITAGGVACLVILACLVPVLSALLDMPCLEPDQGGRAGPRAKIIAGLERRAVLGIAWFAAQWAAGGILAAVVVAGAWFRERNAGRAPLLAQWLIAVLCMAEILSYGRHFLVTSPRDKFREIHYPQTARVAFLQETLRDGGRFLWFDSLLDFRRDQFQPELLTNRPVLHGLPQLRGYDPVNSRRFGLVMNQVTGRPLDANPSGYMFVFEIPSESIDWRLLALWDCRAALSYYPLEHADIEEAASWRFGETGDMILRAFRLRAPTGARLAQPFVLPAETSLEEQTLLVGNPRFRANSFAIVRKGEFVFPENASPAPNAARVFPRTALLVEKHAGQLAFEVSTPEPAVLVVSQNYYPGWKARVDGKAALVYPADVAQCGISVPAGKHTVELRYRPRQFYQGAAISLCSLGLLVLVVRRLREEN